jgi:superfamily II DNA helicase RecQ
MSGRGDRAEHRGEAAAAQQREQEADRFKVAWTKKLKEARANHTTRRRVATKAALENYLRERLNINTFRDGQFEAVEAFACTRRNSFVMWAPGNGKSIVFQCAVLLLRGLWVLEVPLNAIIDTHVSSMKLLGIRVLRLGQNTRSNAAIYDEIEASSSTGEPTVVVGHPEALVTPLFLAALTKGAANSAVRGIVIDEAGLITQWQSFRPDFLRLSELSLRGSLRFLLLDGSSHDQARMRLWKGLGVRPSASTVVSSVGAADHPSMYLAFREAGKDSLKQKTEAVVELQASGEKVVVFSNTKKRCEAVQDRLMLAALVAVAAG